MPATEVSGMLICTGSSVSRLVPFTVTPVKLTEPKLVSGRTLEPPEVFEGASAMASAEARSAPAWVVLMVCVPGPGSRPRPDERLPEPSRLPAGWQPSQRAIFVASSLLVAHCTCRDEAQSS
jgi:hypothetical protein